MSWWFPALATALLGTLWVMALLARGWEGHLVVPPLIVAALWFYAWRSR